MTMMLLESRITTMIFNFSMISEMKIITENQQLGGTITGWRLLKVEEHNQYESVHGYVTIWLVSYERNSGTNNVLCHDVSIDKVLIEDRTFPRTSSSDKGAHHILGCDMLMKQKSVCYYWWVEGVLFEWRKSDPFLRVFSIESDSAADPDRQTRNRPRGRETHQTVWQEELKHLLVHHWHQHPSTYQENSTPLIDAGEEGQVKEQTS